MTWTGDPGQGKGPEQGNGLPAPRLTFAGWLRVGFRLAAFLAVLAVLATAMIAVRAVEMLVGAGGRRVSSWFAGALFNAVLVILGLRVVTRGQMLRGPGAIVANHSSWLDIVVLNARNRVFFVSKAEVAGWPGIGLLARLAGTVFIRRDRREAAGQVALFRQRIRLGHKLLFFPEGTSTDGRRVLPFKSTLFAAFYDPALRDILRLQPASVIYHAPPGADPRFYGWWGEMEFGAHFLRVLAAPRQGWVELVLHPPVAVADFADRKALAAHCEAAVREGFEAGMEAALERPGRA